jgi:hypothetical protein
MIPTQANYSRYYSNAASATGTLSGILLHIVLLPLPLETGQRNTFNFIETKNTNRVGQTDSAWSRARRIKLESGKQCFGSGSALNLSPGSGFQMRIRIRIQLLIKLAPNAKIINIILELFD